MRKFVRQNLISFLASPLGSPIRLLIPAWRGRCRLFPRGLVIYADGRVTTCCMDALGQQTLGSVYAESLEQIWRREASRFFSQGLFTSDLCRRCIDSPRAPIFGGQPSRREWKKAAEGYLSLLIVEIMACCNYGCCDARDMRPYRQATKADLGRMFNAIQGVLPHLQEMVLFNVGESLLHEGFCDFVRRCRAETDANLLLSTNGLLLDSKIAECLIEERLNKLIVSVHGGPGTENMLKYSQYGADYDRVLANVARLVKLRDSKGSNFPLVELRATLFEWNDSDELMDRLRADARAVGASLAWTVDWAGSTAPRASKRFLPGSAALLALKERGELCEF